jgi:hypothetical protein
MILITHMNTILNQEMHFIMKEENLILFLLKIRSLTKIQQFLITISIFIIKLLKNYIQINNHGQPNK